MKKENKKTGRPREYDTKELRKVTSIRLTETQVKEIKKKYKSVQDFIEDAYDMIVSKK